jgi:hypothetical protein
VKRLQIFCEVAEKTHWSPKEINEMPVGDFEDCLQYWNAKAVRENEQLESAKHASAREELLAGIPGAMARMNAQKPQNKPAG